MVDSVVLVVIMVLATVQAGMATLVVAWVAHFLVDQVETGTVGPAVLDPLVDTVQASQAVVLVAQMLIGLEVLDLAEVEVSVTLEVRMSLVAALGIPVLADSVTWEVQIAQVVVLEIQVQLVLPGLVTLEVALVVQAVALRIQVLVVLAGLGILMMTAKVAAEGNF